MNLSTRDLMKLNIIILSIILIAGSINAENTLPREIQQAGISGGIIVKIGLDDPADLSKLYAKKTFLIHGLDTDITKVESARKNLKELGIYGRISVNTFDGKTLPYSDNLINLVIADKIKLTETEILRVLAPLGTAYINGKKITKPWPSNIDEWPQYLHGADNNGVAQDDVVGPPRHLQWVNDPVWSRSHMTIATISSVVSSRGRLFSIEDTATPENALLPGKFALTARDAFNGIVLWRHEFTDWEPVTRYIKWMTVQLQRRLAAIGNDVYCTPGLDAPITKFDALTGEILKVYSGTESTQEFAYFDGIIYAVTGDRMNAGGENYDNVPAGGSSKIKEGSDPSEPFQGSGFRKYYSKETRDKEVTLSSILAFDVKTGDVIWRKDNIENITGGSLALKNSYAVYQSASGNYCLNNKTGKEIWSVEKMISIGTGVVPNALLITDEGVYIQEGKKISAYSLTDGEFLWSVPTKNNYNKPSDLFYIDGRIWTGGSGVPSSYDAKTGTPVKKLVQKIDEPMGHDRCYRNLITKNYYINSKTGGADFLSLENSQEFPNEWVRGTCGFGVLPCNGLLYSTPYSCQCSLGSLLTSINALYTEKGLQTAAQPIDVNRTVNLVKGPSYNKTSESSSLNNWPTYRRNNARSGSTPETLPAELKVKWKFKVSTVPSPPIIAENKVFISDKEAHTIIALNSETGKKIWDFTTGGKIDSPPTYYNGNLYFGSRDGWLYCVNAADGTLAYKFKDLPDRLLCSYEQIESAWPINGSTLINNDTLYFSAGISSFVNGGLFLYGLNPLTGEIKYQNHKYGPFNEKTKLNIPNKGFKNDIFVGGAEGFYLRFQGFNYDLSDKKTNEYHLVPSAGFLDDEPQHRTFWTISNSQVGKGLTKGIRLDGDIMAFDGERCYIVQGFLTNRQSTFDPRTGGYDLIAYHNGAKGNGTSFSEVWRNKIPLTGKAILLANEKLFIAGTPVNFKENIASELSASHKGDRGGILWVAAAADGTKLAEYKLEAAPQWDGMAAANNKLYITLKDGTVACYSE
jgi:outer membrane protein assembly factor BamB